MILALLLRYWKPVAIIVGALVLVAGVRYAWEHYDLSRVVKSGQRQNETAIRSIDAVQADSDARARAIEALARQANDLQAKADQAEIGRQAALAEARSRAETARQAENRITALEAQRRAQPVIRGLAEAHAAIMEALR